MMKGIFFAHPWRRFKTSAPPFSRHSGFTLIEISLSLVLLAVGVALSLPSYREMIEKRQSTLSAEQMETHSDSQSHRVESAVGNAELESLCSSETNQAHSPDSTCPEFGVQQ